MQTIKLSGPVKYGDKVYATEIVADDDLIAELRSLGVVDEETHGTPGAEASPAEGEIEANLRAELERQLAEMTAAHAEVQEALQRSEAALGQAMQERAAARAEAEGLAKEVAGLKAQIAPTGAAKPKPPKTAATGPDPAKEGGA